jgi:SpoVK/Ycf46/Vps4 family AAA+-type ATPase
MPRLDLVLALIRAGSSGDVVGVQSATEAIASEEAGRGHVAAAERLRGALATAAPNTSASRGSGHGGGLLVELPAKTSLKGLVLEDRVRTELVALVREQRHAAQLAAEGLSARHTILLSGPPGNGKTSVAEAIAHELGIPFNVVSYSALVGSLLGETIQRIELLFTQAAAKPCVMFFDEFEALGKERADRQEAGEMKRAVASMLTGIDTLQPSVVVVAATNHPEMLDRAVWRRFEVKLVLGPPNGGEASKFLISQLNLTPNIRTLQLLSQCLPSPSYAELRDFALDISVHPGTP